MLRKMSLLLAAVLALSPLVVSCGTKGDTDETTTAAVTDSQTTTADGTTLDPDDRANTPDALPAMDFGGADFTVLCRDYLADEIDVTEINSEIVNDAVFNRNRKIDDKYNVNIKTVAVPGDWHNKDAFMSMFSKSVTAGDGAYDLVAGYEAYFMQAVAQGLLTDLNNAKYFDFAKPWWSKDVLNELTVNDKLYVTTGDLALSLWENTYVVFFNKQMVKDYGIENPYQLVDDGKWTLAKLDEICKGVTKDLDGDGTFTRADLFGYATETGNLVDVMQAAFDMPITVKEGDAYKLNLGSPKMVDIVERLYSFLYENPGVYAQPESVAFPQNPMNQEFSEDRVMFLPDCLGNSEFLRAMETDYGIIPLPKFDEQQKQYQSWSQNGFSIFGIPVDCKDVDMAAFITEALCAESYRTVIPAYYDITLKTKFARDEESARMMDLVREGLQFNFGFMYSTSLKSAPGAVLRFMMTDKTKDIVSYYSSKADQMQTEVDQLVEQLHNLP